MPPGKGRILIVRPDPADVGGDRGAQDDAHGGSLPRSRHDVCTHLYVGLAAWGRRRWWGGRGSVLNCAERGHTSAALASAKRWSSPAPPASARVCWWPRPWPG